MLESVDLLMICQVVSVACTTVCRWVTTHFCFIRVMLKGVLLFSWGCSCPRLRPARMYGTCTYFNYIVPVDRGGTMVKVLCYKSEGRGFDSSWCHWNFLLT